MSVIPARAGEERENTGHNGSTGSGDRHQPDRSRLHILVLTDRDWTHPQGGGTGTNLQSQVMRWLAWGHRVSVIASGYPCAAPVERRNRLTIYRVGGRSTVFPAPSGVSGAGSCPTSTSCSRS